MTIICRTDSDGIVHQVWAQRQAASCAVASIWMARNQALQMTVNEGEWSLAWAIYQRVVQGMPLVAEAPAPMTFDPRAHQADQKTFGNMFSRSGTYMDQVATALEGEGLKVTYRTSFSPGTTVEHSRLSDTTPAIVLLGWYDGAGQRNGGHFIVASRVARSGRIVYLDPWGGQLREMRGGPGYQSGGSFEQVIYLSR